MSLELYIKEFLFEMRRSRKRYGGTPLSSKTQDSNRKKQSSNDFKEIPKSIDLNERTHSPVIVGVLNDLIDNLYFEPNMFTGMLMSDWYKWSNISSGDKEKLNSYIESSNETFAREQAKIGFKKMFSLGHNDFVKEELSRHQSKSSFKSVITKDIEIDNKGNPVNLSDLELNKFYKNIWQHVHFMLKSLKFIISKSKSNNKKSHSGTKAVMDQPGATTAYDPVIKTFTK